MLLLTIVYVEAQTDTRRGDETPAAIPSGSARAAQPTPLPTDPAAELLQQVRAFKPDDLFPVVRAAQAGDAIACYKLGLAHKLGVSALRDASEAFKWFHAAAEKNFGLAEEELFLACVNGSGTAKDPTEGLKWLRRAAEHGRPSAQLGLGLSLEKEGKYSDSVAWFRLAAEQGNVTAETALGFMYEKGRGVDSDATVAALWYRRAAEQGEANAQSNLGSLYSSGNGVPKDPSQAAIWFRKSADQGWAAGQVNLAGLLAVGSGMERDWVAAYMWAKLAEVSAIDNALKDQSRQFLAVLEGRMKPDQIEKAKQLADEWARNFAQTRRVTVIGDVRVISPVPAPPTVEMTLRQKAAENGDAKSQLELGVYHYRRRNYAEAMRWFTKAAEQHNAEAEYSIGVLHLEGSGTPKDEAEAARWFEKAAGNWNLSAMNNLVAINFRQKQIPENLVRAYMWTIIAASAGHNASQINLAPIKAILTAEQVRDAESAAAAWREEHPSEAKK